MLKIWHYEKSSLLTLLAVVVILSLVYQNPAIAIGLPFVIYIGWLYYRLYQLEQWLKNGSKLNEVTDDSGLIGQIVRHIYHQKKLHSKRKKRTKLLLRRLNTNIAALPDATVLLNKDFESEWFNEAARYLLKLKREDLGLPITYLIRQPEFLSYLQAPQSQNSINIDAPDDPNKTLQLKIVSFGNNQRLIIARDISEQMSLQKALKGFIANASHELKTPLTSIIGYLEILEMETGLSDIGKQSVAVIEQQSKRMQDMIQDLIQLSRIESSSLEPDEGESIEVQSLMQNVMSALSQHCDQGRMQCKIAKGLKLLANAADVMSICSNLLENALKHCATDTQIAISWQVNSLNELVYCVTDSGAGIAEADIPLLTQRYYRGLNTTADQISGSGLGLSIVEQAAIRHGGHLSIKSQPGQGSQFCVTFPSYRTLAPASSTFYPIKSTE